MNDFFQLKNIATKIIIQIRKVKLYHTN